MIQFPASTTAAGMCMAAPDVCKTPAPPIPSPIPIPYPNMAQVPMALNTSTTVLFENRFVVTQVSTIPRTNGDEPGVAGGVVSGVFGDQAAYKTSSSKVFAEGKKVCMLTSVTGHNGTNANCVGLQAVPSQVKVWVAL
jgi:Toxin PAAR-like domain